MSNNNVSNMSGSYVEVDGTAPSRLTYSTWYKEEDAVMFHWLEDKEKHDSLFAAIKGTGSGASRIKQEKYLAWERFVNEIYMAKRVRRTVKAVAKHINNLKDKGISITFRKIISRFRSSPLSFITVFCSQEKDQGDQ